MSAARNPDEPSEIRGLLIAVPGLRFAYPGYEVKKAS